MISEDYLKTLSTDNFDLQATACSELSQILNNPDNYYKMIRWANTYQNVKFDDFHKEIIITSTSLHYPLRFLRKFSESPIDINNDDLSFEDYKSIDIARKYAIIKFLSSIISLHRFSPTIHIKAHNIG